MISYISIHTFLAEGDAGKRAGSDICIISIHTFLAEGDAMGHTGEAHRGNFNPHLPCGRRRYEIMKGGTRMGISIHTFLAEGDEPGRCELPWLRYFNPHLPCGRRPDSFVTWGYDLHFNPHLPCGRRPECEGR